MFSAFLNVNYELEGFSQFPCTPTLELIISSFLWCLQFLWSCHYPHPTIFCFYGLQVSRVMPSSNTAPSQVRQKLVLQAAPQKSGILNTCSTLLFPLSHPRDTTKLISSPQGHLEQQQAPQCSCSQWPLETVSMPGSISAPRSIRHIYSPLKCGNIGHMCQLFPSQREAGSWKFSPIHSILSQGLQYVLVQPNILSLATPNLVPFPVNRFKQQKKPVPPVALQNMYMFDVQSYLVSPSPRRSQLLEVFSW